MLICSNKWGEKMQKKRNQLESADYYMFFFVLLAGFNLESKKSEILVGTQNDKEKRHFVFFFCSF